MEEQKVDVEIWSDILPDMEMADKFIDELLPNHMSINAKDFIENILKGNWVIEPTFFIEYIKDVIGAYIQNWKSLFVSIIVLFILSAMVSGFLSAMKSEGVAKMARMFFLLCQMLVIVNAFKEILDIVQEASYAMIEFLKVMIPGYMICIASTGAGLTAAIFYKILLGCLCLIESIVISTIIPIVQGYVLVGIAEGVWGEGRFKGILDFIRKGVQWSLKVMLVILTGSGVLQMTITPVVDKTNLLLMKKSVGAIPGIGDIADSISSITVASAIAVKNSMGILIMVIMVLILLAPLIKVLVILITIKAGVALGGICGEIQMIKSVEYISEGGFMLLRMLLTISAMFFISIAAITNVTS